MKKVDPLLEAGLEARAMRKSLGYSYLAADEIIRTMRELREALPKTGDSKALAIPTTRALPVPPKEKEPDS